MDLFVDGVSAILLFSGVILALSGAVGIIRFPDVYSRLHAASVTDTLATLLIIAGLVVQAGFSLISAKLIFIWLFLWYTSPASSHALVRAVHQMGIMPYGADSKNTPSEPPVSTAVKEP